jgi:hypothetical protein
MDAIITAFIPATNTRGSRVKATTMGLRKASATIGYDHALNAHDNHRAAAECLITKLGWFETTFVSGETETGTVWVSAEGPSDTLLRVYPVEVGA